MIAWFVFGLVAKDRAYYQHGGIPPGPVSNLSAYQRDAVAIDTGVMVLVGILGATELVRCLWGR